MARGVNKVILIGNVGNEPDLRYTQSGNPVVNFSVATSEQWKDKQTGQPQERTEWHKCEAWGRTAEIISQYVSKGLKVYIEGALKTDKWQDNNGVDRYTTKIQVREIQFLGSQNQSAPPYNQPTQSHQPAQHTQHTTGNGHTLNPGFGSGQNQTSGFAEGLPPVDEGFEDDIPF